MLPPAPRVKKKLRKIRIIVAQVRSVVDGLNQLPHSANKKSKPDSYDRQNNDCHNAYHELVGP
jgi:hypothetical protein